MVKPSMCTCLRQDTLNMYITHKLGPAFGQNMCHIHAEYPYPRLPIKSSKSVKSKCMLICLFVLFLSKLQPILLLLVSFFLQTYCDCNDDQRTKTDKRNRVTMPEPFFSYKNKKKEVKYFRNIYFPFIYNFVPGL